MHKQQRKPKLKFDSSAIDVDSVLGSSSIEGIDSVVAEMRDRSPLEPAAVYILPERAAPEIPSSASGQTDQWSESSSELPYPLVTQTSGHDTKLLKLITKSTPNPKQTSDLTDQWPESVVKSGPVVNQTSGMERVDAPRQPVVTHPSGFKDHWSGSEPQTGPLPTLTSAREERDSTPQAPARLTTTHSDQWSGFKPEISQKPKYVLATTAQAAHDVWEQAVYDALWAMGWSEGNPPYKDVSAGYSKIRAATRFGEKTIIRNIRSLKEKLAIEEVSKFDRSTNKPNVYRVYSYREILNRRKSAGLQWVAKNKLGVTLTSGQDSQWSGMPSATRTSGLSDQVPVSRPVVSRAPRPVASQATLIANKREKENTTSTALREMLQAQLAKFDDAAVGQLWAACQKNVPDVTVEEVSELFHSKHRIAFAPGVKNPIGLLITAVANACTPAAIAEMRWGREVAAEPEIVRTREEQIADLEFYINEFPPDHEQMAEWRRKLEELREGN
jgi:hypothetical protein